MSIIHSIDDKINIGKLLYRHINGDDRHSHIAEFVALMLREAGADVTTDDVYAEMFNGNAGSLQAVNDVYTMLLASCYPQTKANAKKKSAKTK